MRRKEKKKNGRTGETEPRRRKEKKREEQGRLNPGTEREEKKWKMCGWYCLWVPHVCIITKMSLSYELWKLKTAKMCFQFP